MKPGLFMLKWKSDGEFLTGLETCHPDATGGSGWSAIWGSRKHALYFPHLIANLMKNEWSGNEIVLVRVSDHSGTSRNKQGTVNEQGNSTR